MAAQTATKTEMFQSLIGILGNCNSFGNFTISKCCPCFNP
ncbi:hypothetical protein GXM_02375 [Nostoc sphaeroides CCNUC1]|uniref:Uncharacterized protein n=1 Tax=Nostoc sphaeroides CCNUC1 TaxID=2653204 RepID=A0A5P8VWZ3_9NOSO|nr:hypothetical protein GXM_02375 [Nostoc sphaeroides CCNUC1]